jgi:hypothetical protein
MHDDVLRWYIFVSVSWTSAFAGRIGASTGPALQAFDVNLRIGQKLMHLQCQLRRL